MSPLVYAMLLLSFMWLAGCGAPTSDSTQMDQRYHDCLAIGGSFQVYDEFDGKYACTPPAPATVTVTEVP